MNYLDIYERIKDYRKRRALAELWALINPSYLVNNQNYLINLANHSDTDIAANQASMDEWVKGPRDIQSATWFVSPFTSIAAGAKNILDFMKFMYQKGIFLNIVILGHMGDFEKSSRLITARVSEGRGDHLKVFINPAIADLPRTDIGVATFWYTAYALLTFKNTRGKFYFVQDDERLFYSGGLERSLAEETYRLGFTGITNAEGLKQMYTEEFGGRMESYFPVPEQSAPYSGRDRSSIRKLFFYARPEADRNGLYLGLAGIKEILKRHPDIEVVTAGSEYKFNTLGLRINNLGKIPYDKLNEFYAGCDAGIYIILSRHTGVIPFELMASGCPVLINRHHFTQSYLREGENCLMFDLAPSSIAASFDRLYEDNNFYNRLIDNGLKFISGMPSQEDELGRIFQFMTS